MAAKYSYTEVVQMACSDICWSCDWFLFFFFLSNGICAKTSHHTEVISLQWVTNAVLYAKMSNRHSHYFCLVLWRNAHLCTKHFTKAFILGRQGEECIVCFYLGKGLSRVIFCLWPLGLEKHQLKTDASLWHSSQSLAWGFFGFVQSIQMPGDHMPWCSKDHDLKIRPFSSETCRMHRQICLSWFSYDHVEVFSVWSGPLK